MNDLTKLRNEYTQMPIDYLKTVAIQTYGLAKSDIKSLCSKTLVDKMIAVEFKNCYK